MSDVFTCIIAGNVVLQKLLVIKGVPNNCAFIGIDQSGRVCPVAYVSYNYQHLFAFYNNLTSSVTLSVICTLLCKQ